MHTMLRSLHDLSFKLVAVGSITKRIKYFSTIFLAMMIVLFVFTSILFVSDFSFESVTSNTKHKRRDLQLTESVQLFAREEKRIPNQTCVDGHHATSKKRRDFDARVRTFLQNHGRGCQVQFFMTWMSPAVSFGGREFLAAESIFKSHPSACLLILSKSLDSRAGRLLLKPLLDGGYRVRALTPNISSLLHNTPAQEWHNDVRKGKRDPGKIPLVQNLSNLIRLAVLYKYGGVYLDTDFIVLGDFSGLRNAIGAQSVDANGNWTRLNNAVLVFDKNHPLLYEFMKEFEFTFNGNIWGHNGPYLVSRVVERISTNDKLMLNFAVLPPMAFYPVDWTRIHGFFKRPNDAAFSKWTRAKLRQLTGGKETYGIHLWNRRTGTVKIEEGSVISTLISHHCIVCQNIYTS